MLVVRRVPVRPDRDVRDVARVLAGGEGDRGDQALLEAIERPAERVGLHVEPGLADTILGDAAGQVSLIAATLHRLA